MTIKKPMKVKPSGASKPAAEGDKPASTGGAAIANRFKLDVPAEPPKASASGPAVTAAFIAALLSLGVAGFLTYLMWKHWEFLMPV